jgi:hypothetical protein
VVDGLDRREWEVTTATAEGTLGWTDREHLRYAAQRDWTLLTFDDDFIRLAEGETFDIDHSGIVFISQHRRDVGELVRRIHTALERNRDRDLTNEIVYA